MQLAEHFRKNPRDDQPVLERVACPRRGLRAVAYGPPAAVRRAGEIDRVIVQPDSARRRDAAARPQVAVLAIDERRRQQPLGEQFLLAVEIGQDGVEQPGTLGNGGGNPGPFVVRNDQRQRVERPRTIGPLGIGIDVVGDAVFLDPAVYELEPLTHLLRRHRIEVVVELPPVRPHHAVIRQHLVVTAGAVRIDREECTSHEPWGRRGRAVAGADSATPWVSRRHFQRLKRRKSSVNGCSAVISGALTCILPGV